MKKILIISPYFPPTNAADMHRIRMSLPYFNDFGWDAEVVTVDPKHSDLKKDSFLSLSVMADTKVHYVDAFSKRWTSKFGLGSIALRSLVFYKTKVNKILKMEKFDIIYFSTTQFPVCVLGPYWKKKFDIPYVIDMQDPWHSTYYRDKPKNERPAKYWFSYRLNKYLEAIAMKKVDGIISVSASYLEKLKHRYNHLNKVPLKVLTFGHFKRDFAIAKENSSQISLPFSLDPSKINLIYVGRGGFDMIPAVTLLFKAFRSLLDAGIQSAQNIRFHFIGTSYAPQGRGSLTFTPIAKSFDLEEFVSERTDRVSFYESILSMQAADGLLIPGSNDPGYTASKIYPYLLTGKPILGLFRSTSSAYHILKKASHIVTDFDNQEQALLDVKRYLTKSITGELSAFQNWDDSEDYAAKNMTKQQCELFDSICSKK